MKKANLILFLFGGLLIFNSSCKKEDPEIPNEEEVITTMTYTLTPDAGGPAIVLSFQDLDGDGGSAPIIHDDLDANGQPIGLTSSLTTTDPGTGILSVILRHQPNKSADGVSDGAIDIMQVGKQI